MPPKQRTPRTPSTIFDQIPWKRFVPYWIVTYLLLAGSSLLLFTFWLTTGNGVILFAMQVWPPALLIVMAWLYFRGVKANDWPERLLTAFIWILLIVIVSAALMLPVYGYPWTSAFGQGKMIGYGVNFASLLLGGIFAAMQRTKVQTPEGLEV